MTYCGQWTQKWAESQRLSCEYFQETPSTNDLAKSKALSLAAPHLILADSQSKGRGRGQNTWTNAMPGACLLATWIFPVGSAPQPITAPLVGLAVYRALQAGWPRLSWSLKAPNDIYLGHQKVAGLLVENLSDGKTNRLLVGLGLNVFAHPDLEIATSLAAQLKRPPLEDEWQHFLQCLQYEWDEMLRLVGSSNLDRRHRQDLLVALNRRPDPAPMYREVLADGGLVTWDRKQISWQSL